MEAAVSSKILVNIYSAEGFYVIGCNEVYHIKIDRRFGGILLAGCFIPVAYLAYSSTLEMKAIYPSETSADFERTT
jgi:hypothetical protein